ncbi:MAG: hypothetical protein ACLFQV_11855 [Vulcanimicrobiota bacterium]
MEKIENQWGFRYRFITKKGFTHLQTMIKKIDTEEEKPREETRTGAEKIEMKAIKNKLVILFENHQVLIDSLKNLSNYIKGLFSLVHISFIESTICLEDPYQNGLLYGLLGPFCNDRICLVPNFVGNNYIVAEFFIMPSKILGETLKFLAKMPCFRIYKLYKRLK